MKRQSFSAGVALTILAVLGLAGPAAAGEQVPFHGNLDGTVQRAPVPGNPSLVSVAVNGIGNATQLGQFDFAAPHYVNTTTRTATGTYTFTAANGDTLTATFTGQATPTATSGVLL